MQKFPLALVLGTGFFVWSVIIGYKAYNLTHYGVHTEGEVTHLRNKQCNFLPNLQARRNTPYDCVRPTITFSTQEGKVSFEVRKEYQLGEKVGVIYMAESPQDTVDIDSDFIWFGSLVAGVFSFGFLAWGIARLRDET